MKSTTRNCRYLYDKDKFLGYAYRALRSHFKSYEDFIKYFNAIKTDEKKSLFLKTASFYLFLVKDGKWCVDIPGSDREIDYLDNSLKYIVIFSLIESLSDNRHVDFYEYLVSKKERVVFPVDKEHLRSLYKRYKVEFGSIRRCVSFFEGLSTERQNELASKVKIGGKKPSIENMAKFLYNLRSRFVHNVELIHHVANGKTISFNRASVTESSLRISDILDFFEEGLIAYFGN